MKFSALLELEKVPEWREKYVDYIDLKDLIKSLAGERLDLLSGEVSQISNLFLEGLFEDTEMVDIFYKEQRAILRTQVESLRVAFRQMNEKNVQNPVSGSNSIDVPLMSAEHQSSSAIPEGTSPVEGDSGNVFSDLIETVKRGSQDAALRTEMRKLTRNTYTGLTLLLNYALLNQMIVARIVERFNNTFRDTKKVPTLVIDQSNHKREFYYAKREIAAIQFRLEDAVADGLYGGDHEKALQSLRPKPKHYTEGSGTLLFGGFAAGVAATSLLHICRFLYHHSAELRNHEVVQFVYIPLIRICLLPTLMFWGFSWNIYVWSKYHINYSYILGFDPRYPLNWQEYFQAAAVVSAFLLLCSYFALAVELGTMSLLGLPSWSAFCFFVSIVLLLLFNPLNWHNRYGRMKLVITLIRIITVPLFTVNFLDFFLADQFVSLNKAFHTIGPVGCRTARFIGGSTDFMEPCMSKISYAIIHYLVLVSPSWFRLLQCIRRWFESGRTLTNQIVNAGKYAVSLVPPTISFFKVSCSGHDHYTVCFISLYSMEAVTNVISTIYSAAWDYRMDWGLMSDKGHFPLRRKLSYPKIAYYVAALINIILRFAWCVSISLSFTKLYRDEEVDVSIFAFLEILRRIIWNIFRLENEHLNNLENYRAFKPLVLPLQLMDDEDHKYVNIPTSKNIKRARSYTMHTMHKFGIGKDETSEPADVSKVLEKMNRRRTMRMRRHSSL